MRKLIATTLLTATLIMATPANAADPQKGTALPNYGQSFAVDYNVPIPKGIVLKHAFDRMVGAEPGTINRDINSVARFINMHHLAGIPLKDINAAVVIHGSAIFDVTKNEFYKNSKNADNANAGLIKELLAAGARVIVCGQSAMSRGVSKADLIPGVELALSAMTAHVLLQQEGYTLNPF